MHCNWLVSLKPFLNIGFLPSLFLHLWLLVEEISEDAFNCNQQKPTGSRLS